jgi:uncharacterized membrane protein (DUF485 family)
MNVREGIDYTRAAVKRYFEAGASARQMARWASTVFFFKLFFRKILLNMFTTECF